MAGSAAQPGGTPRAPALSRRSPRCMIDLLAGTPRVGPRAPPDRVDGLETSRGHEPRSGIGRHAVARPLLERGPERVVQRLLGAIEVAEQADQRGQDAARLGAVDRVHELAYVLS